MKLNKDEKNLLIFLQKYAGWQSYSKNKNTLRALGTLVMLDLAIVNINYGQMRLK